MKKLFLAMIALCSVAFGVRADGDDPQEKSTAYFVKFEAPDGVKPEWVEALRNEIMSNIMATNRVALLDQGSMSAVEFAKAHNENAGSADMSLLQADGTAAAAYVIQGNVSSINVNEVVSSDKKNTWYEAIISYTINVLDPVTGKVVHSQAFKHPSGGLIPDPAELAISYGDTPDQAVTKYATLSKKPIKKFMDKAFPLKGWVLDLEEYKNNEAKKLYINLGSVNGIEKGAKLIVREERKIGGKTSLKTIGEIEVVDVESDEVSLCKVKKGGKEIYTRADPNIPEDERVRLYVTSATN